MLECSARHGQIDYGAKIRKKRESGKKKVEKR
jgi:hypothetical protein